MAASMSAARRIVCFIIITSTVIRNGITIPVEEIDDPGELQVKRDMKNVVEGAKFNQVKDMLYQLIHGQRSTTPTAKPKLEKPSNTDEKLIQKAEHENKSNNRRNPGPENNGDRKSGDLLSKKPSEKDKGLPKKSKDGGSDVTKDDKRIDEISKQPRFIPIKQAANKHANRNNTIAGKKGAREKIEYLFKENQLWIAAGAGSAVTIALVVIILLVRNLVLKCRRKAAGPLNMNYNCLTDGNKEPIYVRLSQLHNPRNGNHYVVSVLDDSNNFSIGTSSTSSSEEEIFNATDMLETRPSGMTQVNLTSTPIKEQPARLSRSLPTTPIRRNLMRQYRARTPPVSPLAREPPVFASPIKLDNGS